MRACAEICCGFSSPRQLVRRFLLPVPALDLHCYHTLSAGRFQTLPLTLHLSPKPTAFRTTTMTNHNTDAKLFANTFQRLRLTHYYSQAYGHNARGTRPSILLVAEEECWLRVRPHESKSAGLCMQWL